MRENYKILYVDDEPINTMLFSRMFGEKYQVVTAASAQEGLMKLTANGFKVVLSDMKMPKMSGMEFVRKAKPLYPDINYYILTGFEINPEIKEAIETGLIKSYFQKPFDMDEIETALAQISA